MLRLLTLLFLSLILRSFSSSQNKSNDKASEKLKGEYSGIQL